MVREWGCMSIQGPGLITSVFLTMDLLHLCLWLRSRGDNLSTRTLKATTVRLKSSVVNHCIFCKIVVTSIFLIVFSDENTRADLKKLPTLPTKVLKEHPSLAYWYV